MIEAVNSVVSNAPLLRGNAEQSAASVPANPTRVQEAANLPQAPYISPYIYMDVNLNKAVLQIRDSDTGDVLRQFPSENALRVRQYGERRGEQPKTQRAEPQANTPEQAPAPEVQATQAAVAVAAFEKTEQASAPQPVTTVVTSA